MDWPSDRSIIDELLDQARTRPALLQSQCRIAAHQYLRLYRLTRRLLPQPRAVLDWGLGNGHFAYFLARSGHDVTGFTLDGSVPDFLPDDRFRAVMGDPAEPTALPFAEESFDAVFSVGVLEHVRETGGDELASLREIRRALRPGGLFIAYHLPNRYSAIEATARWMRGKHHHRYRYRASDLKRFAIRAGMEQLELDRYGLLPRNSARHLPRSLSNSPTAAQLWDQVDALLGLPLGGVAQNLLVVLKKPRYGQVYAPDGAGSTEST